MANCIEEILCNQTSDCEIFISDKNGFEIDTRYLHDNDDDYIYIYVGDRKGYTLTGFTFHPIEGDSYKIEYEVAGKSLYKVKTICNGTYVANFSTNVYELNVIPYNSRHGIVLGSGRYPYNTLVHISATENPGYHFVGWYINDTLISNDIEYEYTVTENVYIVGHFEGDQYSIVAKPNNRILGTVSGSGVYEYGTAVTLVAAPLEGSTFVSWDDNDTSLEKKLTVTQNKVYVANFQRNRYTVTVNILNISTTRPTETCGVVTGEGIYDYGTVVTLYASPALGFGFVSWENGLEHLEGNTRYSFTIQSDTIITATFDDAMYNLTLYSSPTNGGYTTNTVSDVLFTGGTYRYNTIVPAQALPYSGYSFDKWSDGTLTDTRTFTMTSDITQTAYFIAKTPRYTLKIFFDSSKGDVLIMNGLNNVTSYGPGYAYATVDSGTTLTAIVRINSPYVFGGWDDSTIYGTTRVFTLNENITREVYITQISCYSTFTLKDNEVKFTYNEITYTYTGSSVDIDLLGGKTVTVFPSDESKYIGGVYDVTDPSNPINVTQMSSSTGSFCYEAYPQTDTHGYVTGYSYALSDERFNQTQTTPNQLTIFRRLHTDTNHTDSDLYIDPSQIQWDDTENPDRNSFDSTTLPLGNENYNFTKTYYRCSQSNYKIYYEKITIDITTIPTLPAFPITATISNSTLSPYLVKVPVALPIYSFTQGYNIYMMYHEPSLNYDTWDDISLIIGTDGREWNPPTESFPDADTGARFITNKTANATYAKRINSITFTPECNHVYEICGLGVDYSHSQYMYKLLGNGTTDTEAETQGIIPQGASVTTIQPQTGTEGYTSLADLTYYNPISASSLGNYVKARPRTQTEDMSYYQVVEVCQTA